MANPAPAIADRFELVERVGGGAFGEVFRAVDRNDGSTVAVKRLHAHLADDEVLARFEREAEVLARVRSPHVVSYLAHGRDEQNRPWLATEWLAGDDLGKWRARPGLTLRDALDVARGAALGTAALHAARIVHRDLKPANIFVTEREGGGYHAKLVDLGIAHLLDATALTQTGMILGSPTYMSPEQVRGERVGPPSDLWSLGVVLFELVAGEAPFYSANVLAVLGKVLLEPAPPLDVLVPGLPPGLGTLVEKLLEKDPESRPGDAGDLAAQLSEVLTRIEHDKRPVPVLPAPHGADGIPTAALAGERRLVALLFARISEGSHAVGASGGMGAGEPGSSRVAEIIERFGGRAERLHGAWLGGFGLTRTRGDELQAAAEAALEVSALGARVGLVTGLAEVRGGSVHAGSLIERGAQLLDEARGGEVRVGNDALSRLTGGFRLETPGAGAESPRGSGIKRTGRSSSVLRRDVGADAARAPGAPTLLLGKTVPAVGREKELRLLEGVFLEAVDERASRLALVVGDAGIGKSRLLYEFIARARASASAPEVLSLRGEAMSADVPYALWIKGLQRAAGLESGSDADAQRERLRAWVQGLCPGDEETAEFLAEFVGLPAPRESSPALRAALLDPALLRQRVREALARLLRGMCARGPLLLAVEDVHWADRAAMDLLAWLHEECRESPLVAVAFGRPELFDRHPSLFRGAACTELRLAPLSQRASEQLVSAALPLSGDEVRALAARAGGNPLFLEELVRARALGVTEMPAAVHAVLQVRLDALGADARRLAQVASVFGQSFWAEGIAALRGVGAVGTAISQLVRAELVAARPQSRYAQTTEYAFSHALVRDVAYAMLVDGERAALHARAARWLEHVGESDAAMIGQHLEQGGMREPAAGYYARAAARALSASAFDEAELYATRSLACQGEGLAAAEALLLRAEVRRALGRGEEMLADAHAARALAGEDPALQIRALSRVAEAQHALGDLAGAESTLRSVLEESHAALLESRIQALLDLALVDLDAGKGAEAATLADEVLSWLDDAGPRFGYQRLLALRARASALAAMGDLGGALVAARKALEACTKAGHRARAAEARVALGHVLNVVGRADDARREVTPVVSEARVLRAPHIEALSHHMLGVSLAALGQWREAREAQDRAVEVGTRIGALRITAAARTYRLLHTLDEGIDVSTHAARAALWAEAERVREGGGPYAPLRCVADALMARVLLASGDAAGAVAASGAAVDVLESLGALDELEEMVRLVHAEALRAAGRTADADAAIEQACARMMGKAATLREPGLRGGFMDRIQVNRRLIAMSRIYLGRA